METGVFMGLGSVPDSSRASPRSFAVKPETRQALALTVMDSLDSTEPTGHIRKWLDGDSYAEFEDRAGLFWVRLFEGNSYTGCNYSFDSEGAFLDAFHSAVTELNETGYGKPMRT